MLSMSCTQSLSCQRERSTYILLEGDQLTYERVQSIKKEYGNDLEWLLPFPGDWHVLKNYQEVLLKIYLDAGTTRLGEVQWIPTKFSRI